MNAAAVLVATGVLSGGLGLFALKNGLNQSENLSGADALALAAPSWVVAVVLLVVAGCSLVGVLVLHGVADLVNQSRDLDERRAQAAAQTLD